MRWTWRLGIWILIALPVLVVPATADEPTEPDHENARRVVEAVEAGTPDTLRELAAAEESMVWVIVDSLSRSGHHDAAVRLASFCDQPLAGRVSTYVSARRADGLDREAQASLSKLAELIGQKKLQECVELGMTHRPPTPTVPDARVVHNAARVADHLSDLDAYLALSLRAAELCNAVGWRMLEGRSWMNAGVGAIGLGRLEDAIRYSTSAIVALEDVGAEGEAARVRLNVSIVLSDQSRYEEAKAVVETVIPLFLRAGDSEMLAQVDNQIGSIQLELGELDSAEARLSSALAYHRQQKDDYGVGLVLMNLGRLSMRREKTALALSQFEAAYEAFRRVGKLADAAGALANMGVAHGGPESIPTLRRALELYRVAAPTSFERVFPLRDLAREFAALEDFERARPLYREAIEVAERAASSKLVFRLRLALAKTYPPEERRPHLLELLSGLSDDDRAERFLVHEALTISATENDDEKTARAEWKKAQAHADTTHPRYVELADAVIRIRLARVRKDPDALLRAADHWRKVMTPESEVAVDRESLVVRSAATYAKGQLAEARSLALQAMINEDEDAAGMPLELGARSRTTVTSPREVGVAASLRLGDVDGAIDFLERGLAHGLLQQLSYAGREEVPKEKTKQALAEEARAREALAAAARDLQRAQLEGRRKPIRRAHKAYDESLRALEVAVEALEFQRLATLRDRQIARVDRAAIQAALRPGDALVYAYVSHILQIDDLARVDFIVVTPNAVAHKTIDAPFAHIDDLDAIGQIDKGEDVTGPIARLTKTFAEEVGLPETVRHVLFCPTPGFTNVPYGLFLGDRDVTLVPSASAWHALRSRPRQNDARLVAAFGDPDYAIRTDGAGESQGERTRGRLLPLPESRAEVERIGDKSWLGGDANERNARAVLSREEPWKAVHFACHGLVDSSAAMFSSLALARDDANDGYLTALEIVRLPCPTELVVLSACETARGIDYQGEGLMGLTYAFLSRGVRTVLASLWKVDDAATRELMVHFYALWNPKDGSKGRPAHEALRLAQEHVRSQPEWKHPYYWAAWTIWGDS